MGEASRILTTDTGASLLRVPSLPQERPRSRPYVDTVTEPVSQKAGKHPVGNGELISGGRRQVPLRGSLFRSPWVSPGGGHLGRRLAPEPGQGSGEGSGPGWASCWPQGGTSLAFTTAAMMGSLLVTQALTQLGGAREAAVCTHCRGHGPAGLSQWGTGPRHCGPHQAPRLFAPAPRGSRIGLC